MLNKNKNITESFKMFHSYLMEFNFYFFLSLSFICLSLLLYSNQNESKMVWEQSVDYSTQKAMVYVYLVASILLLSNAFAHIKELVQLYRSLINEVRLGLVNHKNLLVLALPLMFYSLLIVFVITVTIQNL